MDYKKMTIDDIARDLQISKTTVSRAISGKGRIGQETRDKVLKYIKENNYRPNAIAKGLAQSKTFNIALVIPQDYSIVDLPFYQGFLWGISNTAAKADYDVLVSMVTENDISQLIRLINNRKVDGVILGRTLENDMAESYLKERKIPFVTAGSSTDPTTIQIDNDHFNACRELTGILLQRNLKKMALLGGNIKGIVNQKRILGYRTACVEAGVAINDDLVYLNLGDEAGIGEVVDEVLKQEVDCIVCMDDHICGCVLGRLSKEDSRIQENIQIASFYNSILIGSSRQVMASIKFDVAELATVCCNTLLARIDKQQTAEKTLLGYEVVIKCSAGT